MSASIRRGAGVVLSRIAGAGRAFASPATGVRRLRRASSICEQQLHWRENEMFEEIRQDRRLFLSTAALGAAAAELGWAGGANAQSAPPGRDGASTRPAAQTSLGPLKQIDAGVLNIGYAEAGPADGPPVI